MNTKEMFKQKMETEVARAQTELAGFRARGMGFTAEVKDRHEKHIAVLERKLDATKTRLRELGDAEEPVWESLKEGVENTWSALQAALQEAVENFKTESAMDDLHGSSAKVAKKTEKQVNAGTSH